MKERKELSLGKSIIYVNILYIIFTVLLGIVLTVIVNLLGKFIPYNILSILAIVGSLVMIYISWKLSIICTFKNRPLNGIDTKKIIGAIMIFVFIMGIISMIYDIRNVEERLYLMVIIQNVISIIINLLIISIVPKRMLDKYDGITQLEKREE